MNAMFRVVFPAFLTLALPLSVAATSAYDPAIGLALEFDVVLDDTGEPLIDRGILRVVIEHVRESVEAETYGG